MALLELTKKGSGLLHRAKPVTSEPLTPTLPDVNLLPPSVTDAVHAKMAQKKLAIIGGAVALVVVAGYAGQTAQIMVANNSLDAATAKSVTLGKQVRVLDTVKVFYSGVDAQKAVMQKTMARELIFSKVASELLKNSSSGVQIQTMTVAAPASGDLASSVAACPLANPFAHAPVVTCVQFTGTSSGRESVSAFLGNLIQSDKFANPYVPVTDSSGSPQITFNGSVGVTEKFFSNRYTDDGYLLKGVGAAQ